MSKTAARYVLRDDRVRGLRELWSKQKKKIDAKKKGLYTYLFLNNARRDLSRGERFMNTSSRATMTLIKNGHENPNGFVRFEPLVRFEKIRFVFDV